ncbi:MAG: TIGR03905 family TSCPD domain-containing protein [Desulfovibrionaceae bacterium]|nr:TIGR03905 family TSCPD domain-containing protein [Desulfovibrionaceae bacterium]
MDFSYTPEHVCSKKFMFQVNPQSRAIEDFAFIGGCRGNLTGIAHLIRGMTLDEVIDKLDQLPPCPSSGVSSCPDQLRQALIEIREKISAM